ncbi:MAG TPA: polysaccharide biosynthesis/export family protein [Roseiarcus sp.]|nr:polysaccharide biosynthesis/export family protein [Roseiarcus sp.]
MPNRFTLTSIALISSLATASAALAGGRILAPMDVLSIRVLEQPDLDVIARVELDGTINFPYIGRIKAAGRTPDDVANEIETKLVQKNILVRP